MTDVENSVSLPRSTAGPVSRTTPKQLLHRMIDAIALRNLQVTLMCRMKASPDAEVQDGGRQVSSLAGDVRRSTSGNTPARGVCRNVVAPAAPAVTSANEKLASGRRPSVSAIGSA